MRRRFKAAAVLLLIVTVVFSLAIQAAALDDTYSFKDLGFSVKLPKEDLVITVDTPRGDKVFEEVGLDYDETMIAFRTANIYLRAYDPDKTYSISMTVTKDENTEQINNYSDLTSAERKVILDAISQQENVNSAVEVKHDGNIFLDSQSTISNGDATTYINLCNTVINGMQIDLTLQKDGEEITPEEAKVLTNAAGSLNFDKINRKTGAVFEWWRLLLWVGILVVLSIAVTVIYKRYNASVKRKNEERLKARRAKRSSDEEEFEPAHAEKEEEITFEESLGYRNDEEFAERAEADEMAGYDIKVRDRDPNKGIEYFEDEGSNIDDGTDYFDTYFKEQAEPRSGVQRFFAMIGFYIKNAFKHIGYFFQNLFKRK